MLSDAAMGCYSRVSRTHSWHPGWWRMAWHGKIGESATEVLIFLVGTPGAQTWGHTMMAAACSRRCLVVLDVDVDVYFSDHFHEVKVSTKKT